MTQADSQDPGSYECQIQHNVTGIVRLIYVTAITQNQAEEDACVAASYDRTFFGDGAGTNAADYTSRSATRLPE